MPKVPKSANADNAMPMIAPYFMIASLRSAVRTECFDLCDYGSPGPPFQSVYL
jgi:hypothetical protein